MCVRDEDVRDGLTAHRIEQRRDVSRIVRARVDDRDVAAPDDVADRTLEGERPGIVGDDAAHAWRNLFGAAGLEIENAIVRDVFGHASLCGFVTAYPPHRGGEVKSLWPLTAKSARIGAEKGRER